MVVESAAICPARTMPPSAARIAAPGLLFPIVSAPLVMSVPGAPGVGAGA
jgi:hypothetical protein